MKNAPLYCLILALMLAPLSLLAATSEATLAAPAVAGDPDWLRMVVGLLGGLALFLHGMNLMSTSLTAAAGSRLKHVLERLTTNRLTALLTGAAITSIIQSSSITTVLVVGFVAAGAMSLAQSVGVIIGANVGTTITGQIVAFNVAEAALPMIAAGFAITFLSRRDAARHYGSMLMGLGLIFFGMQIMGGAMSPLRSYEPFLDLMRATSSPLPAVLVAALFTGLVQSSSATIGIVIVMAAQGFITLETGIALTFGASLGTCITAVLASIGKPRVAVRAAAIHVAFNVIGVGIFIWFIPQLAGLATEISPANATLEGTERAAYEVPRQIANAYTMFKVLCGLLFIPFTTQLATLATRLVPDAPVTPSETLRARYLDEALLDAPDFALQRIRLEAAHMGDLVVAMLADTRRAVIERNGALLARVEAADDAVDGLHEKILTYMAKARKRPLTDAQSHDFAKMLAAVTHLEAAGDLVEKSLVGIGRRSIGQEAIPSAAARQALNAIEDKVEAAVVRSVEALRHDDRDAAMEVIAIHAEANAAVQALLRFQADRFAADDARHLANVRLETELMETQKRLVSLATRIARGVLDEPVKET